MRGKPLDDGDVGNPPRSRSSPIVKRRDAQVEMENHISFFVVGSGRSGSTLLRLLLSNHSRIHIPPETWFIADLVRELPLEASLDSMQLDRAIEIITTHYRFPDLEIEKIHLNRIVAQLESPTLRDVINLVYAQLFRSPGKVRFGDKTPPYIVIVPQLVSLYPDAKFIHLIRDGRDVAISFIDMGYGCRFYDGCRFEWIAAMESARSYRSSPYAARFLEVKYEELVGQPETTLRLICDFLGEKFETQMLDRPPQIEAVPPRERMIHSKLERPMSADAIGAWRRKLSAVECFCMEACLHRYLTEHGYPLRFAGRLWWPALQVTGATLRASAPFLDRVIPFMKRRNLISTRIYF